MQNRTRQGLLVLAMLVVATPLLALDRDAELVALVEMPVATTRVVEVESVPAPEVGAAVALLNDLGVDSIDTLNIMRFLPLPDVRTFLLGLSQSGIPSMELIEIVRYVPHVVEDRISLVEGGDDVFDLDDFVALQHEDGLRGTALAAAIHQALRARGVPAGPSDRLLHPVHETYIPEVAREGAGRPHRVTAIPPGQAKKLTRAGRTGERNDSPVTRSAKAEPSKKHAARGNGRSSERHIARDIIRSVDRSPEEANARARGGRGAKGNNGKGKGTSR